MNQELNSNFKRLYLLTKLNFKIIFKKISFWIIVGSFLIINMIFLGVSVSNTQGIYKDLESYGLIKFLGFIFSTFAFLIIVIFITYYYRTQITEDIIFIETRSGINIRNSFLMRYISCLLLLFLVSTINFVITMIFMAVAKINPEYKISIYFSWSLFFYLFSIVSFSLIQFGIILFKQIEGVIVSFILATMLAVSPAISMIFSVIGNNYQINVRFEEHDAYIYRLQASEDLYNIIQKLEDEDKNIFNADDLIELMKYDKKGSYKDKRAFLLTGQVNYYSDIAVLKDKTIIKFLDKIYDSISKSDSLKPRNVGMGYDNNQYSFLFSQGSGNKTGYYYSNPIDIDYVLKYLSNDSELKKYNLIFEYISELYNKVNLVIEFNSSMSQEETNIFKFSTFSSYKDEEYLPCYLSEGDYCNELYDKVGLSQDEIKNISKIYYDYPELLIINWLIINSWINLYNLKLNNFEYLFGQFSNKPDAYKYNADLNKAFKVNSSYIFSHLFSLYNSLPGDRIISDKIDTQVMGDVILPSKGLDKETSKNVIRQYNVNKDILEKKLEEKSEETLQPIFSSIDSLQYRSQLNKFVIGLLYTIAFILLSVGTYFIFRSKIRP